MGGFLTYNSWTKVCPTRINYSRFDVSPINHTIMRLLGTPRPPLCETSPNKRSRVCGSRDSGTKVGVIAQAEQLTDSTVRKILKRAQNQVSYCSRPWSSRPTKLTPYDERVIFRALLVNSKITAAQLVRENVPHVTKKTVYRFLKKSGI